MIHGQVATKKRWRLIADYERRRMVIMYKMPPAYEAWVRDFKGFMLHGYEPKKKAAQRHGAGVPKAAQAVDCGGPAVDASA